MSLIWRLLNRRRSALPITLGVAGWWDVRDLTTAAGDVASIANIAGTGVGSLANAATRPAYTADFGDGAPSATFVAASTEWLYVDGQPIDFWADFTIYTLARRTGGACMWACGNTGNGFVGRVSVSNVGATAQLFDGATAPEATAAAGNDAWRVFQHARTGSTLEMRVDGGVAATVASPATPRALDRLVIGASYQGAPSGHQDMQFRAHLVFPAYHDATTKDAVRAYLGTIFPNVP